MRAKWVVALVWKERHSDIDEYRSAPQIRVFVRDEREPLRGWERG